MTRPPRALLAIRAEQNKSKPLLKGFVQTRIEDGKVRERLFVIDIDGTVLETAWRDYSTDFAKRIMFTQSSLTKEQVVGVIEYCGNYYID